MYRRKRLAIVFALMLAAVVVTPAAAAEQGEMVVTPVQASAPQAPGSNWLSDIKVEHVIAVGAGALAGDLLHGALGLSGGAAMVVGGVLGYYVYVNYIANADGQTARRINGVADEAKLYFVAAQNSLFDLSNELLGTRQTAQP